MNNEKLIQELQSQITKLGADLGQLSGAFYKNNFTSTQTFNKDAIFSSRLRVPVYGSAPTVAEVGDLVAIGGVLYICTTASTGGSGAVWTVVGTQT